MSPADGQAESGGETEFPRQDRPIDLIDIARVLGQSATIERMDGAAIRAWRDDLTLIRESLSYATTILAADVATLSDPVPRGAGVVPGAVEEDPEGLLANWDDDQPPPVALDNFDNFDVDISIDEGLFARTDQLLAAHREMARVDLSSSAAVARTLALVEEQLAILTERQAAVEARLQQIRAVIIRRYRLAAAPAHDRPA